MKRFQERMRSNSASLAGMLAALFLILNTAVPAAVAAPAGTKTVKIALIMENTVDDKG